MKKFYESFREHTIEIINYRKKREVINKWTEELLSKLKNLLYFCYNEKFEDEHATDKKYCKVRDHCHYTGEYRGAEDSICNLRYSVLKEIPRVFHNGSNYNYHLIIKELAEEFPKYFIYLGKDIAKCIPFAISIKRKLPKFDRIGKEVTKTIS